MLVTLFFHSKNKVLQITFLDQSKMFNVYSGVPNKY